MNETALEDNLILRNLDEPMSEPVFESAAKQAGTVSQDLTAEGVRLRWVKSDIRVRTDGPITGTFCHDQAESEEVLREHAFRAGLPVSRIDRYGTTLANELDSLTASPIEAQCK